MQRSGILWPPWLDSISSVRACLLNEPAEWAFRYASADSYSCHFFSALDAASMWWFCRLRAASLSVEHGLTRISMPPFIFAGSGNWEVFFFLPWSCCERSKQRLWAANSRPRTDRSPTAPERVQLGDENRTATSEHEETVLYLSCLPPSSPSSSPRYLRSAPVHSERLHEGVPRRRMAHQYLLGRRHSDQVVPVSRMPASREKGHRGQSLEYDRQEVFAQPV